MHTGAMAYKLPTEVHLLYSMLYETSYTAAYTSIQSSSVAVLFGRSYAVYHAVDIVQYALGQYITIERSLLFSIETVISQGYYTYADDDCYISVDERTGSVTITNVTSKLPMLDSASGTTSATTTASSSPTSANMSTARSHSSISTQLDVLEQANALSSSDESDSDSSSFQSADYTRPGEADYFRIAIKGLPSNKATTTTKRSTTKHTATTNSIEKGIAITTVTAPKKSINSVADDVSQNESSNDISNSLLLDRQRFTHFEIAALVRDTHTHCYYYQPYYINICIAWPHAMLLCA
jgi:hypothetical protein